MRPLLTAALIASAAAPAFADVKLLQHKDWAVSYLSEDGDDAAMCIAATFDGDAMLSIVTTGNDLALIFVDNRWSMTPAADVPVVVETDWTRWTIDAKTDTSSVAVDLEAKNSDDVHKFLAETAKGHHLTLQTRKGRVLSSYSLAGSHAAMAKLGECEDIYLSGRTSDPFHTSSDVPVSIGEVTWSEVEAGRARIDVSGDFTPLTAARFAQVADAVDGYADVTVVFGSNGGSLQAGLDIGMLIHERGFATFVPAGFGCYSSCALAWLAGSQLWVTPTSTVGFHQAYTEGGASVQDNAIVGTYIARLGYGYETTMLVTQAAPEDMLTLNAELAAEAGLAVQVAAAVN